MLELILELIVSLFGELLVDGVLHLAGESDRAKRTVLKMLLFGVIGAAVGWVTLLIFPTHFIRDAQWQIAYLVVSPLLAAWLFSVIGNVRERKGKRVSAVEQFWPAFTFALALAVVRYFGAA
jgi:uncharacterized membrane protein YfcA